MPSSAIWSLASCGATTPQFRATELRFVDSLLSVLACILAVILLYYYVLLIAATCQLKMSKQIYIAFAAFYFPFLQS